MEINESADHTFKGDFIDEVPLQRPFDALKTWDTTLHSEISIKPEYYKGTDFDVIDVCNKFDMNFNLGNVMKYIVRAGKKDPEKHIEDLNKAMEYLQREIDFINK